MTVNQNQKYPYLKLADIKHGCKAALNTAESLISDAEILLQKKRYARTFFLATIAIEEIGKYIMLCGIVLRLSCQIVNWKEFWKRYRNHKAKIGSTLLLFSNLSSTKLRPSLDEVIKLTKRHWRIKVGVDRMKMSSLYSDYTKRKFIQPKNVIDAELAEMQMRLAKYMLKLNKNHYKSLVLYQPNDKQLAEFIKKTHFDEIATKIQKMQKHCRTRHWGSALNI